MFLILSIYHEFYICTYIYCIYPNCILLRLLFGLKGVERETERVDGAHKQTHSFKGSIVF